MPFVALALAAAPAAALAAPDQFVVVDATYSHAADTTKDSHFRLKPAPGSPLDWRRPIDYAAGTAHVHLEVLTKPTDTPTRFQICFEATPGYACTAQSPAYTSTGIVGWSSPFHAFFQYDRVDWTRGTRNVALILKDTKNVKPAPENVGAAEAARYLPSKLRVVVTIVRPGATYVPPAARSPLSPAALAERAGPPAAPARPTIAFPGQYAERPPEQRFPIWPKGCARFVDPIERGACLEQVAFDFASLSRYAAANAALARPGRGEARVVFFGDSITDGWSLPAAGGFFPRRPYVNRGIGGQTTAQMLIRFRADVVALAPRAVVILAGTNDIAGNAGPAPPEAIQANLASMAELARAAGVRVVLASLLPVCDDRKDARGVPLVRTTDRPPGVIRALNEWMASHARRNGHVYLDYHAAMIDARGLLRPELTDDGLHPNAAGYAVMAPLAEAAIARALRVRPAR